MDDGLAHKRVKSILEVAIARFREYQALKEELTTTKNQLAARKVIDKAKGILMKHKQMDEDEAYQSLRKMAMDQGKPIAEVAESVISLAQLFS